jgi:hypothetical protein
MAARTLGFTCTHETLFLDSRPAFPAQARWGFALIGGWFLLGTFPFRFAERLSRVRPWPKPASLTLKL